MKKAQWDLFFEEKMKQIFQEKKKIVDIGGGLRVLKEKGNRFDPRRAWISEYLDKVDYKIVDPVPDYKPDIIGDIHDLPFEEDSLDAIICIAVLEHVENPFKAFAEMYRVLKKGDIALFMCLLFIFITLRPDIMAIFGVLLKMGSDI